MRILIACLASLALAAEAQPPQATPAAQKLIDESTAVASKAKQGYDQALRKEQDKLIANLTKEQERETKKGNLDGALAIKALIEEVQGGLLARKVDESVDLLGDGSKPAAPGLPANLLTDCPIAPGTASVERPPKAIEQMITRASALAIPKGDKTHYTFSVASAGQIAVFTGGSDRNHADLWPELLKAGFKRQEDGEGGAWFVLEAKPGMKFTAFDPPLAGAQVSIFAGKIKQAR